MADSSYLVAIVVPAYGEYLTPDEVVSYQHLLKYLDEYDCYLIAPRSLRIHWSDFPVVRFRDQYFVSTDSYSELLLSQKFYNAFNDYKYILVYQLDCLIFSSEISRWCDLGYDYIGAPWFKSKRDPGLGFSRVGNGGFSLRRVKSFLKVIRSRRYLDRPVSLWKEFLFTELKDIRDKFRGLARLRKKLSVLRSVRAGAPAYMAGYTLNEDHFWSDRAKLFYPQFKVAPVQDGLRFSFECAPRYCFEENDRRLPFGCHAWPKWDRAFWEPHLLV